MIKKKRRYPRIKWVVCLNCSHEYEKEEGVSSDEGCVICGSKEYETSDEKSTFKLDDWNDWR